MAKTWRTVAFIGIAITALVMLWMSVTESVSGDVTDRNAAFSANSTSDMSVMSDMMALPEVPEDMEDPLIDPMKLSQLHTHANAQTETEAEKEVRVFWRWVDGPPEAGSEEKLELSFVGSDGKPVENFEVNNEKKLHLMMISRDLTQFRHVHPEYMGEGKYRIGLTFPTGGEYRMFADFKPTGMNELIRTEWVNVKGEAQASEPEAKSRKLKMKMCGMEIELHLGHLMAGMPSTVAFTFRDLKTGKPVKDLQPYLGAIGHAIAVDPTLEQFIHVHPVNAYSSGPQALFGILFQASGTYKLWGQFQRDGETFVVPFVIDVL